MKTKGFTLVELLVVIAILAILATVSVVGYTTYIQNANQTVAEDTLIKIRDYAIAYDIASGDKDGIVDDNEATAAITHVLGENSGVAVSNGIVTYVKGNAAAKWTLSSGKVEKCDVPAQNATTTTTN